MLKGNKSIYQGKSVVITGAAEGIGFALCQYFANEGAVVTITDVNKVKLEAALSHFSKADYKNIHFHLIDGAAIKEMKAMLQEVANKTGSLDIVILNAGTTNYGGFLEYEEDQFDKIVNLNLKGAYFSAQEAAKIMIDRGTPGRLILLGSITGIQAFPNLGAYGITKAAIIHMSKSIAVEVGKFGITCNTVSPGATVTPRTLENDPNFEKNWSEVSMTPNVTMTEDIVGAVAYLASPAARQVTGQNLIIDGGWTMMSPIPEDHPDKPEYEYKTN